VSLEELLDRPVVLDFVFTRCVAVCPAMTAQMERLARGLPEGSFRRVSITLDPEHDTPEVLRRYAEKRGAPEDWLFLTADDQQTTVELARDGFHLAVQTDTGDPANPIVHSTRFVLIDAGGRIRGYYDALTPEEMEELRGVLRRVR
jgi:protein SCO1/2